MKKINGQSLNPQDELIKQLKKNFPQVFSEDGKVDPEKLKLTLGEDLELSREKYGLSWAGKSDCFREIQKTTTATLVPQRDESVNFDETENIFIEGENLETLRVLQKSYYGKIKMIYIDPPYNTGNDFVYNDSFKQNKKEYQEQIGETNGNGDLSKDTALRRNTKDSGHYHSNWLNMMYPRLFLARNLLSKEGLIFISIDDNEFHNLRSIMNEIFGEENFVADIIWEKRFTRNNNAKLFSSVKEHILLYRKSQKVEYIRAPRNEKSDSIYDNPDNDPRGNWTSVSYVNPATKSERPNLVYGIKNPNTGEEVEHPTNAWKYDYKAHQKHLDEDRLWWGKNGENTYPRLKKFLTEMDGMVPIDLWDHKAASTTDEGSKELNDLLGRDIFDNPKPTKLIKKMMSLMDGDDYYVMDFFAGSATTAHAAMSLNQEDGGSRKFIMVQLDEKIDEDNEAYKEGLRDIAAVARERIRRAGKRLTDGGKQLSLGENGKKKLDIGFKAFKLSPSNFKEWNTEVKTEEELQQQLEAFVSNGVGDATDMAHIYELLLKNGCDLNSKVEAKEIKDLSAGEAGKKVYLVDDGELIICLEGVLERDIVDEIVKLEPAKVIFLETCFNNDDELKTNTLLQMESADIDFRVV